MEKTRRLLTILFMGIVLVPLLLIALFETGLLDIGINAGQDASTEFILTTTMELLTLGAAFLSLRLFKFGKIKDDLTSRKAPALQKWGICRLLLIGLPLCADTLLYYIYMNPSFGYLAIILALCLPFVYPSMGKCLAETQQTAEQ